MFTPAMPDLSAFRSMVQVHKDSVGWIAAISGVLFIGCLFAMPWLAAFLPADYFVTNRRPKTPFADKHPVLRWTGLIVKNLVGVLLILSGILMLVLPGQGLLTIIIGVLLMDFPGKHALERRLIRIPSVLRSINWLRSKRGVKPVLVNSVMPKDDVAVDTDSPASSDQSILGSNFEQSTKASDA
jgi:hypothetical protein